MKRFITLLVMTVGFGVAGTGVTTALAAGPSITASTITSPADLSALFYNGDNGSGAVEVTGTVVGAGTGSKVNLLCYDRSDSETFTLASGVDVSAGTFAADVSLKPVAGRACRLRLVPNGVTVPTGDATAPFTGPRISVSDMFSHSGDGNLWGYDVLSGQLSTSFELQSLGECPVLASFITDPNTLNSFQLFDGNACLPQASGVGGRAALSIDSDNAYAPGAISKLTGDPGFIPLNFNTTFSPDHSEVTINEGELPMICAAPGTFPPTSATCPALSSAGLLFTSKTTLVDGGAVARVDQTIKNTDTHPHTVDALFQQSVTSQASGEVPGFEFPGQTAFLGHAVPDSFSSFPSGPSSIVVVSDAAAQPSVSNPIGAITYNRPPLSANFVSSVSNQVGTFVMHYIDTIQPNKTVNYDWSFSQATSATALASLEQVERDRFSSPRVTINRPSNHATTRHRRLVVTGTVADAVGVASVTVAGKAATVKNGVYSATVALKPGINRITVTGTNLGGSAASVQVSVVYHPRPCVVPELRGLTLKAAKAALRRHDCRAGKTVTVRSRRVRSGRVVGSRPKAGSTHKPLWKVRLYVSRGRAGHARATADLLGL